jgi:hypothetical protein
VKRIIIAEITLTDNGAIINGSTVLCLTRTEEALIGRELAELGFQRFNREQLVKELAKHSDKPLFLTRSE